MNITQVRVRKFLKNDKSLRKFNRNNYLALFVVVLCVSVGLVLSVKNNSSSSNLSTYKKSANQAQTQTSPKQAETIQPQTADPVNQEPPSKSNRPEEFTYTRDNFIGDGGSSIPSTFTGSLDRTSTSISDMPSNPRIIDVNTNMAIKYITFTGYNSSKIRLEDHYMGGGQPKFKEIYVYYNGEKVTDTGSTTVSVVLTNYFGETVTLPFTVSWYPVPSNDPVIQPRN